MKRIVKKIEQEKRKRLIYIIINRQLHKKKECKKLYQITRRHRTDINFIQLADIIQIFSDQTEIPKEDLNNKLDVKLPKRQRNFINLSLKVKFKNKRKKHLLKFIILICLIKKNLKYIQVHLQNQCSQNLNFMKKENYQIIKIRINGLRNLRKRRFLNFKINLRLILFHFLCLFQLIIQIFFLLQEYIMLILLVFIRKIFKRFMERKQIERKKWRNQILKIQIQNVNLILKLIKMCLQKIKIIILMKQRNGIKLP
ncbi:unnamed protein product [Paramecium sonneborni]|uniref:Transmembrane protein n=1 Tax=Paramecium sonneborni TaxID=65129 RepID=A0A8S1RQR7_9CILI|nr:unnamed protein product [Paramecium sonneborni]